MIRVHCECCDQHFERDAAMGCLLVPDANPRPPRRDMWATLMGGADRQDAVEHHLCAPCARALWSLVDQMRRDLSAAR